MNRFLRVISMIFISILLNQSRAFADAPSSAISKNQSLTNPEVYPEDVDQSAPSMSGEDTFIQESQNRFTHLKEQNQNMINEDRKMMQEGYDPNDIYPQPREQKLRQHWSPPNGQK